jgi:hypothetical protein
MLLALCRVKSIFAFTFYIIKPYQMPNQITWKNKWFSETCEFYSGETRVGELRNKTWSESATGRLKEKKCTFRTKGFFKQETLILDADRTTALGKITYNSWRSRALIDLGTKIYEWKYDNAWNTKWSITESGKKIIDYQGSSTRGRIIQEEENEILTLTGLYVTNYYRQAMIVLFIAVFIPIIVAATN